MPNEYRWDEMDLAYVKRVKPEAAVTIANVFTATPGFTDARLVGEVREQIWAIANGNLPGQDDETLRTVLEWLRKAQEAMREYVANTIDVTVDDLKDIECLSMAQMKDIATQLCNDPYFDDGLDHQAAYWSEINGSPVSYLQAQDRMADWAQGNVPHATERFMRTSLGMARVIQTQLRLYRAWLSREALRAVQAEEQWVRPVKVSQTNQQRKKAAARKAAAARRAMPVDDNNKKGKRN